VLERTGAHPRRLLDMGRARLTRLISKASSGHLGEERAQDWLDAAHLALELYGDHPARAFDDRAAEVVTEVRLLRATEGELPAHESAREQAYRQVDPDQLARSLPGVAAVGGPALAALVGDARRFPDGASFRSFTGLAPRASETGETDRKGQPMSKAGPSPAPHHPAPRRRDRPPPRPPSSPASTTSRSSSAAPAISRLSAWSPPTWASAPGRFSFAAPNYELRDVDGTLVTPEEAKALAARWKVPDEVRQRRRQQEEQEARREGPSPSPPGTCTARSQRAHEATFPRAHRDIRADPDQAGAHRPPGANECSLLTSTS